jgi:hypothetical protein
MAMRTHLVVPPDRLTLKCKLIVANSRNRCHFVRAINNHVVRPCRAETSGSIGSGQGSTWRQSWSKVVKERSEQIKSWGLAGVISYGLLKTLYYSTAFLVCWYYADIPKGQGMSTTLEAFLKVFAMVWAGSQVTKLARYAGAAAMAPFMDKALENIVTRFSLKGKRDAFFAILALCLGLAACVFGFVVLAWS